MDRRLIQAYDRMTMPEGCSRRIEAMLQAEPGKANDRKYTRVLRQNSRRGEWVRAAALGCLALAMVLGGTLLLWRSQTTAAVEPSETPRFSQPTEETAVSEKTVEEPNPDRFPYGQDGRDFLEAMCRYMPDCRGYASLDDVFWQEFLYRSVSCPGKINGNSAETILGDLLCLGGEILLPRDQAERYCKLATGCDLPDFATEGSKLQYRDGYYRIAIAEGDSLGYLYREGDAEGTEAVYDIYEGQPENVIGSVEFLLYPEENENGFVIIDKKTYLGAIEVSNAEAEAVAERFAYAYHNYDLDVMRELMTSRENWDTSLDASFQHFGTENRQSITIHDICLYDLNGDQEGGITAYVNYNMTGEGYPVYSEILTMQETEEGWKVRYYDTGWPDSYDPDRLAIYRVVEDASYRYLFMESRNMKELLTGSISQFPVYKGKGTDPEIQKITVYYEAGECDPVTGEPIAQAYVEYRESEEALNGNALWFTLVKTEAGWKIGNMMEG